MKIKPLAERIYRSGYTPLVVNIGWCVVALGAGVMALIDGSPLFACVDFFCAGVAAGCTVAIVAIPYRLRRLTDIQKAELEREAQQIVEAALREAQRRGLLPADADVNITRLN